MTILIWVRAEKIDAYLDQGWKCVSVKVGIDYVSCLMVID